MKKLIQKIKKYSLFRGKKRKNPSFDLTNLLEESPIWWGQFSVTEHEPRYIKIGHTVLCIDHFNQEWRVVCQSEHGGKELHQTFSIQNQVQEIIIKPTLPDRTLTFYLDCPIYIPPNGEVTLYALSPVWIQVRMGTPDLLLAEIPTQILSDSWDGKNTLEGDLCYAGNAPLVMHFEDLPEETDKIITPVTLINQDRDTLILKEIKIPATQLSVYHDIQNLLCTELIRVAFINGITVLSIIKNTKEHQKLTLLTQARFEIKQRFKGLFKSFR